MLAPVRSLRRNPWPLLREPTTYMARVREKMERAFRHRLSEVGEEQFARDLVGVGVSRRVLLDGFARIADHLREEERAVAELPGGAGILGLLGAADARVRNSPLIAFLNLKLMLGVSRLGPMGQVHRALQERGEPRARMLLRAVADISEELYRPYFVEVWNLTEFAEGRVPRRPGRFGRLVEDSTSDSAASRESSNPSRSSSGTPSTTTTSSTCPAQRASFFGTPAIAGGMRRPSST